MAPRASDADQPAAWAAVVVGYESGEHLVGCVNSVLADDSAGRPEVVVVDNSARDGSADALREALPAVPVLSPGRNVGYARAANLGTAATRSTVVAVLNADVVVAPGTGAAMLRRFDADPRLGAVGPMIANPDGTPYPSARRAPRIADAVGHAVLGPFAPGNRFTCRYLQLDADPALGREADWVSGAAVWLRREALDEIGGWDERFFLFFEDLDLCRRLGSAGWRVAYEPAGRVVHALGVSRSTRPYRSVLEHHRAALRYADIWWRGPRRALLPFAALFLGARATLLGVCIAGGRVRASRAR